MSLPLLFTDRLVERERPKLSRSLVQYVRVYRSLTPEVRLSDVPWLRTVIRALPYLPLGRGHLRNLLYDWDRLRDIGTLSSTSFPVLIRHVSEDWVFYTRQNSTTQTPLNSSSSSIHYEVFQWHLSGCPLLSSGQLVVTLSRTFAQGRERSTQGSTLTSGQPVKWRRSPVWNSVSVGWFGTNLTTVCLWHLIMYKQ